jgi:sugar lactone lactonase YvrE
MIRTLLAGLAAALLLPAAANAEAAHPPCAYTAGAQTVTLGGRPFAAQPTADGCWMFVSLTGVQATAPGIAVLRNENGAFRLAHLVKTPGQPAGVALSHDGRTLAVAAQERVLLLDVDKLESGEGDPVRADLPEGADTGAIYAAFSLDDGLLFISEERRARLAVIDAARAASGAGRAAVTGYVPQGRAPVGLALSADGRRLYATSELAPDATGFPKRCAPQTGKAGPDQAVGVLSVIDVARAAKDPAQSVVAAVNAGCGPVRVALSPDGATAWVSARGDDALLAFATASLRGVQADPQPTRRPVGSAPVGVAVRPDGQEVWASNSDRFATGSQGTLSALKTAGGPARTVASGGFPRDMTFLPDGKTLVVAVFRSGAIQFVPTDRP